MPKTIGLRVTDSLNAAIEKKAASEGCRPSAILRRLCELWLADQIDIRIKGYEVVPYPQLTETTNPFQEPPSLPSERPVQARKPKAPSPKTCEHDWVILPLSGRSVCDKCGSAK